MSNKTVLVFEYTPVLECCPECGAGVYTAVSIDSIGQGFRFWACEFCEWHEDLGDWVVLSSKDTWDWLFSPGGSTSDEWELRTRRVVKE